MLAFYFRFFIESNESYGDSRLAFGSTMKDIYFQINKYGDTSAVQLQIANSGCIAVFPKAQINDDCWHALENENTNVTPIANRWRKPLWNIPVLNGEKNGLYLLNSIDYLDWIKPSPPFEWGNESAETQENTLKFLDINPGNRFWIKPSVRVANIVIFPVRNHALTEDCKND